MRRTARSLPVIILAALALAGCDGVASAGDGHDDHGRNSAVAADAGEIDVDAGDFAFAPDEIMITAGEEISIAITATDIEHDFVVDEVDFHVHADPGETEAGALRIDEPGTYTAYCSVPGHRDNGMEATVTVTD